jgi:hypothetical protein
MNLKSCFQYTNRCISALLVLLAAALPAYAVEATKPNNSLISGGVRISPTNYGTVSGFALGQPVKGVFQLKNARGHAFSIDLSTIRPRWSSVPQEGTLKVYGLWKDGVLHARNMTYDDGLYGSHAYSEGRSEPTVTKATLSGTVVADADKYGFDLQDKSGTVHSVLTGRIPGVRGAKTLRAGSVVRVYGDKSIIDNVSQLEATNLVIVRAAP